MKNTESIFNENKLYNYNNKALKLSENRIEGSLDASLAVYYSTGDESDLTEELKAFLTKLLGAAKHNLSNTLIINDAEAVKFNQLTKINTVKKVFVFGTTRNVLGINLNIKRYKIYNIQSVECLFVDRLDVLQADPKRKAAMWSLMKTMFNIA